MICNTPQAWVEGIKEIIEPLLVLMLAWTLGDAIEVMELHQNCSLMFVCYR